MLSSIGACLAVAALILLRSRVVNWPLFAAWLVMVLCFHLTALRLARWNAAPPEAAVVAGRDLARASAPLALGLIISLALALAGHRPMVWWGLAGAVGATLMALIPSGRATPLLTVPIAFLALGPALTTGLYQLLIGCWSLEAAALGLPLGLMAAADAWTESLLRWPVARARGAAREIRIAGVTPAVWLHILLMAAGFCGLGWLAFGRGLGWLVLLGLTVVPLWLSATGILIRHPWARGQIALARLISANAMALTSLILAFGLAAEVYLRG